MENGWHRPGILECGETLEEGAAHETYEEIGVIANPENFEFSATISLPTIEQVAILFSHQVAASMLTPAFFMLRDGGPTKNWALITSIGMTKPKPSYASSAA